MRRIRWWRPKEKLVGDKGGGGGGKERSSTYFCKLKAVLEKAALKSATGVVSVTIFCKLKVVLETELLKSSAGGGSVTITQLAQVMP